MRRLVVLSLFFCLSGTTLNWNGCQKKLPPGASVNLPITPNAPLMVTVNNPDLISGTGSIRYNSGGHPPSTLAVPSSTLAPAFFFNPFPGNNLKITNTSLQNTQPLILKAWFPGVSPKDRLSDSGRSTPSQPGRALQSDPLDGWFQLIAGSFDSYCHYAIFQNKEVDLVCVNFVDSLSLPPHEICTRNNRVTLLYHMNQESIYIVNLSPSPSKGCFCSLESM